MSDPCIKVSLVDGRAAVRMETGSIRVARHDAADAPYQCPVELIAGALGS